MGGRRVYIRAVKAPLQLIGRQALISALACTAPIIMSATPAPAETLPTEADCEDNNSVTGITRGWCIAIHPQRGNCLACHTIGVQPWPQGLVPGGNIGPPLEGMRERTTDRATLRARVWDPTRVNPRTSMPPYGRHKVLTEDQIDAVVDFLLSI